MTTDGLTRRPALDWCMGNGGRVDNVVMLLLVPADVLRPRRVDEHFAAEAEAARAGGHRVAVVDHDALAGAAAERAVERVPSGSVAVYRGWMLTAERYAAFAAALAGRDTRLRTGPDAYRRGHELPGWYSALAAFTPESAWTVGAGRAEFEAARSRLGGGPGVLRDYSKSMKHYWHEAAYLPDLGDAAATWRVAERFRELRGDDFAGGFVLRRFEPFTGAEIRTWWIDGVCRLVTAHPDTPDQPPPAGGHPVPATGETGRGGARPPTTEPRSGPAPALIPGLADAVAGLGLPFVTVDLARRTDGTWRVIELGDGQVSDRPGSTPPESLISAVLSGDPPPTA